MMCGLWGTGSGTISYTENIGAIGITKVTFDALCQNITLHFVQISLDSFQDCTSCSPKHAVSGVVV